MRVISGLARGRMLRAAEGTRPTADLIKGAIFSMLEALAYKRGFEPDEDGNFAASLAWPRVLDLYAGSGALGLEALSRGSTYAEFVDRDREAARVIESNLRMTDLLERAHVLQLPVASVATRLRGPFDLVLADPPYDDAGAFSALATLLGEPGLLADNAICVLEHRAALTVPERLGGLAVANNRKHGQTGITLYAEVLR
jgi:16S rRNA (guanine966-N2)-methyltransferase